MSPGMLMREVSWLWAVGTTELGTVFMLQSRRSEILYIAEIKQWPWGSDFGRREQVSVSVTPADAQ